MTTTTMTTDLDNTPEQRVTRSAQQGYCAPVTTPDDAQSREPIDPEDSQHIADALAICDEIDATQAKLVELLAKRDRSIVLANREDGIRPPKIARALEQRAGVSLSNVRTILRLAKAREH